jgi:phosphatidylserine decarboxylase
MFRFHKEGISIVLSTLAFAGIFLFIALRWFPALYGISSALMFLLIFFVAQFFRNPVRIIAVPDNNVVYAPADGKIVVIEQTEESEYFHDKRIQVSIFMSPLNVHVNRYPVSGIVEYFKFHAGSYLPAWNPKSSTSNERTTIVVDTGKNKILLRQIAGAMARRIITYSKIGAQAVQGEDLGFIRFGSRVDIFLPLDAQINVSIGEKSVGNKTVIARLS